MVFQEDRLLPGSLPPRMWRWPFRVRRPAQAGRSWLPPVHFSTKWDWERRRAKAGPALRRNAAGVSHCPGLGLPGELLLLDEPFKGLDGVVKDRVIHQLPG